ncbi:MAG: DUF3105 domain-containing protein [Chloroflexi bacterium]|nr:DUF3105 domain-containing protein [Chloroflexota bacterium]
MAKQTKPKLTRSDARAARRARQQSKQRFRRLIYLIAAGTIGGLVILSFVLPQGLPFLNRGSSPTGESTGPGQAIPLVTGSAGRTIGLHVEEGQSHPPNSSVPGTSGWHYPQPARWGIYSDPIADEKLVHNLEHGGIGIHYSCPEGCEELVTQLTGIAKGYRLGVILSPFPGLETKITLTAWGWIDRFNEFDEKRILDFIQGHIDRGPEPLQ